MFLRIEDLDEFVSKPTKFEELLNDLIRAEAWVCNVPQHTIRWDERTNVPDGGQDIVSTIGSNNQSRSFLPAKEAIWSAKSGKDGLESSLLDKEIREHSKVLQHLADGGVYVWCTVAPASQDKRSALQSKSNELANEFGFSAEQIILVFRDTLYEWLKNHPGVIRVHFNICSRAKSLEQWQKLDANYRVDWVDFGSRSSLVDRIKTHCLAPDINPLLYVTGRSGIGKTRAVLQACSSSQALRSVLYYENIDLFYQDEVLYTESETVSALIVIDDVQIADWDGLRNRLPVYNDRLRIVAIGPTIIGGTAGYQDIIEVPVPESAHVAAVINSRYPEIAEEDARRLANECDHDLRLGLLVGKACAQDPELRGRFNEVQHVWNRILQCFSDYILDQAKFEENYEILSLSLDVGNRNGYRSELDFLASYFGKSVTDLDRTIDAAIKCGLGRQQGRFFEASPAALGRWMFEVSGWPLIKNNAVDFVSRIPTERMRKRLLERSYECSESTRLEVTSALAEWFHIRFPCPDIFLISDRESSRVFASYTELDPTAGLRWLRRAVNAGYPDRLKEFDGAPDGSGGWRGRRQIVWLCEHLSCFEEHFWDCEEILFKLALCETEHDIGNNSTAAWCGLFLPVFSWSTIPFSERYKFLLNRLGQAVEDEEELLMKAAIGALESPVGRIVPPRVVGGRLVPMERRPSTYSELYRLQREAAKRLLEMIKTASPERKARMTRFIIPSVYLFIRIGHISILQDLFLDFSVESDIIRLLRVELATLIRNLRFRKEHGKGDFNDVLSELMSWYESLEPIELCSRIKEITGRTYWDFFYSKDSEEDVEELYRGVVKGALGEISLLDDLKEWFSESDPQSTRFFGYIMGIEDIENLFLERVLEMIKGGSHKHLVSGYINGTAKRLENPIKRIYGALDSVINEYPRYVSEVTLYGDCSVAGLRRLEKSVLLSESDSNPSLLLIEFGRSPWNDLLNEEDRNSLLDLLFRLYKDNDQYAVKVAIDLASLWYREEEVIFPNALVEKIIVFLDVALHSSLPFEVSSWDSVVTKLPDDYTDKKIQLYADALTTERVGWLKDHSLKGLIDQAKEHPLKVMEVVGKKMLDPQTKVFFFINAYTGLFETIGLEVVRGWVEEVGEEGVIAMARHLESPAPKESDPTFVPPLTKWVLSEFWHSDRVFSEFLAGRHAFEVLVDDELEDFDNHNQKLEPYLKHELRRVREWAEYEIHFLKRIIEDSKIHSVELERL